ncbi:SpaA isopeptide-forming pilin-related protein [Ligilactobacillus aviarius]|uniref:SpaA isopeptide-forming pilin-related protein n=1 Tax=Ligilactobacillus aviarius TaxID=1606 RepID=UPI0019569598|nr:SpaA isopeptide-forming pilin-related protein [Ligilactobacillus aviarius]MBM6863547.1 LPXTG cell wall anchor domain-containing protein [Ligilactobacillus aviarius]
MDKVKEKLLRLVTVIASILLAISPALSGSNCGEIKADDVTSSMVDSVTTNIGTAKPGSKVTFHVHFSGKKDYPVKAGDTITINFPKATQNGAGIQGIPHQQPLIYNNPDNPNDPDNGKRMGRIDVTKTGVTITFNKTAAGLKTIGGGDFQFTGTISVESGTNPTQTNPWPQGGELPTPTISVGQKVPSWNDPGIQQGGTPNIVMPTGQVSKSGAIDTRTGNINWQVHGVLGKPGITTISDTAQDGQTFLPNTFHIKFFGQLPNGQWENITIVRDMSGATGISSNDLKNSGLGSYTTNANGFNLQINDNNVATALSDNNNISFNGASGGISFGPNVSYKTIAYTITYQTKLSPDQVVKQWNNEANQTNPDGTKTNTAQGIVVNTWSNDIWGTQPKDGVVFDKQNSDGQALPGAVFELTGNGQDQKVTSTATGMVKFSNLTNGEIYTVKEIKAPTGYKLNNETITVKIVNNKPIIKINGSKTKNNIIIDKSNESSSSSISSSSSKKSSSNKISSSSKKSSSIKSSSSKKSSSIKSSAKSSSVKSSSSKKSSSIKSSSSKKSSSIKSSAKSSSKKSSSVKSSSSKKSSSIKSSSSKKSSSIKSSAKSSSVKSSSSKKSSSIKVSSSSKKSSSVKASSKSVVKNTEKSSSMKNNTIASSKSAAKNTEKSSSLKNNTTVSSKSVVKNTTKSSSVASSMSSKKNNTTITSKSQSTNTEKVPSKVSTISYVNKSTEVSVPVTVSSNTNTTVESSVSSEINNGSSSSIVNKPTLVSSSVNVPATSWTTSEKNEKSVVKHDTTVIVNKKTTNNNTTNNTTNNNTTNNITNNHNVNKDGITVVNNNNNNGNGNNGQGQQGGQNAQENKSGKGNGHGEGLPQTGEAAATAVVGLGVALIAISGVVVLEKKKN